MKFCKECGEERPESEFYVKNKKTGALFSLCKKHHGAKCAANYQKNLEENRQKRNDYNKANREARSNYMQRWRVENRERDRANGQRHDRKRAQDPQRREKRKGYAATYRVRHAEEIQLSNAQYRANNREILRIRYRAWCEDNPEAAREIASRWRQANRATVNACTHRRRARLAGCAGTWTASEWKALKEAQDNTCLCCGRREPEIQLTFDHVVPVSDKGDNTIANAQGLCLSCNIRKHTDRTDFRDEDLRAFLAELTAVGLDKDLLLLSPEERENLEFGGSDDE